MYPKVSIIIPTYKRSNYLPRAIDSVLSQTYENIQVIVVDDNDPDTEWRLKTSQLMKKYEDNYKVKYICHQCNMNGSVARNTGLRVCDGDLVTYLDDDDLYRPDKVEKQVRFLLNHPEYKAVYCGWHRDGLDIMPEGEGDLSYGILSGANIIITNSIMMWRDISISCGGWDANLQRHQEAAYLLNFFRAKGKMGKLNEVLIDFDTSDRSNVSNPQFNECQIIYLLQRYKDIIESCSINNISAQKEIYVRRYLGIVLTYFKTGSYAVGLIKVFKYGLRYPILFFKAVINYCKHRASSEFVVQSR